MSGEQRGLRNPGPPCRFPGPASSPVPLPATEHSDESPLLLRDRAVSGVLLAHHAAFPEPPTPAAHAQLVALGTHHPSQQLVPDGHRHSEARVESAARVWKFLNPTVCDKQADSWLS